MRSMRLCVDGDISAGAVCVLKGRGRDRELRSTQGHAPLAAGISGLKRGVTLAWAK